MNYQSQVPKFCFSLICILFLSTTVSSQVQQSLQEQYRQLVEKHETYERYKVIPTTSLDTFWAQVEDSVSQGLTKISELQATIETQQATIDTLKARLGRIQVGLNKSNSINDQIIFFGIPFSKIGYHFMVWGIIIILAVLAFIVYSMFIRSNKMTRKSLKEFDSLKEEYERHKDKTREREVKLKRELQTAINTIDDMKRRR